MPHVLKISTLKATLIAAFIGLPAMSLTALADDVGPDKHLKKRIEQLDQRRDGQVERDRLREKQQRDAAKLRQKERHERHGERVGRGNHPHGTGALERKRKLDDDRDLHQLYREQERLRVLKERERQRNLEGLNDESRHFYRNDRWKTQESRGWKTHGSKNHGSKHLDARARNDRALAALRLRTKGPDFIDRAISRAGRDGRITQREAHQIELLARDAARDGRITWSRFHRIDRWEDQIDDRRVTGLRDLREDLRDKLGYRLSARD
ncbi:MAG: hypothetical protein MRY63_06230 [Neomegalonema sp.]|nr:hypothetical protein [Neomegalonema sp.]